jgi:hypothetical protein
MFIGLCAASLLAGREYDRTWWNAPSFVLFVIGVGMVAVLAAFRRKKPSERLLDVETAGPSWESIQARTGVSPDQGTATLSMGAETGVSWRRFRLCGVKVTGEA